MGVLESGLSEGLAKIGLGPSTTSKVSPSFVGPDFPEGFQIVEIIKGQERKGSAIVLAGHFMPLVPFEFGGTQKIVKDFYPGNSEPVVQVLGSRENDTTVKGKLSTKRFKDQNLRGAAIEYQELIDAMRLRGNLVKITLGEWRRYAFIEECNFKLNLLTDIEYEIKFTIVGFNPPSDKKFVSNANDDLIAPNTDLTNKALAALLDYKTYPAEMPKTLTEALNEMIGDVAEKISLVTNFVEGIVTDAEKLMASANRAIGLIKNARATISRTSRRVGALANDVTSLGSVFISESQKTAATLINVSHLHKIEGGNAVLNGYLAEMQRKFQALASTAPQFRHLVRQGDSLQTLSMKYYQNADNWKGIHDHNKLQSTELVVGSVLEIPKA